MIVVRGDEHVSLQESSARNTFMFFTGCLVAVDYVLIFLRLLSDSLLHTRRMNERRD